jgi:conjugal transfer/entry exclusion protein
MINRLNLGESDIMHYDKIHGIQKTLERTKAHPKFQNLVTDIDRLADRLDQQEQELQETTIPREVSLLQSRVESTRDALDKRMKVFENFISKAI